MSVLSPIPKQISRRARPRPKASPADAFKRSLDRIASETEDLLEHLLEAKPAARERTRPMQASAGASGCGRFWSWRPQTFSACRGVRH